MCNGHGGNSSELKLVSIPDSPSTLQENIHVVQHFSDVAPALRFLTTNHLALLITPLQTYLADLQFTEAQQATSKAELLAESIATASSWWRLHYICQTLLSSLEEGLGMRLS